MARALTITPVEKASQADGASSGGSWERDQPILLQRTEMGIKHGPNRIGKEAHALFCRNGAPICNAAKPRSRDVQPSTAT
jgi:hypothetical protein